MHAPWNISHIRISEIDVLTHWLPENDEEFELEYLSNVVTDLTGANYTIAYGTSGSPQMVTFNKSKQKYKHTFSATGERSAKLVITNACSNVTLNAVVSHSFCN